MIGSCQIDAYTSILVTRILSPIARRLRPTKDVSINFSKPTLLYGRRIDIFDFGVCQNSCDKLSFAIRARNGLAQHTEPIGDLSPSLARPARISPVARERWAQTGITVQFLIVVRTLGEFFRLRHVLGTSFSVAVAATYVGGALAAACFCWASVTSYFFRRYTLSACIALAAVVILLVYKIALIGW
jgi:hypothetical protein